MNVAGKSDVGELVGRSQELERLLALLEEARSGRGRAALVLGEAGIGDPGKQHQVVERRPTQGERKSGH